MLTKEQAYAWAKALCCYAGEGEAFLECFWQKLLASPAIYEEFCYYPLHQDFYCRYKIQGVTVVDVMIWQMDHFKARLDEDSAVRLNKDRMLLMAFDTFLDMEKDPTPYLAKMSQETGTDYPGKY